MRIKRSIIAGLVACGLSTAAVAASKQPNILVIWGDDIGWQNVSAYGMGTMGYTTPAIDSIGLQGIRFTDHYAQPSSTAGRAAFITGQYPIRSGMTTVGQPGDTLGLQAGSPSLAEVLTADGEGNVVDGDGVLLDAEGNLVINTVPGHVVTLSGVSDMVVVHTVDATMVTTLAGAENVKALVARVADQAGARYV